MKVDAVKIRRGSVKDINSILELFNREIPQHWVDNPRDFWIWTNESLSHKKSIISLAEYKKKIIGYYCIIPKLLKIGDKVIESGIGIHAVTDSDFKKEISIIEVTNLAYRIAKDSGIKMIYGFPNNDYCLVQEKLERWDKVKVYNSIETKISDRFETPYDMEELTHCWRMYNPNHVDELIFILKDSDYYYQRYTKNPRSLYKSFSIMKNDDMVGLIVTKIFNSTKGHIVDFIIDGDIKHEDIIKLSNNYFLEKGIIELSVWPTSVKFKEAFCKLYNKCYDGFGTNFYVKFLDNNFKVKYKDEIMDMNNWNLPMGTSDAF